MKQVYIVVTMQDVELMELYAFDNRIEADKKFDAIAEEEQLQESELGMEEPNTHALRIAGDDSFSVELIVTEVRTS